MKKTAALMITAVLAAGLCLPVSAAPTTIVPGTDSDSYNGDGMVGGDMTTELWLQVEAAGQIDVTVPLVMIFRTDIDGGQADTATNYQMTNNSTAQVVVTKIATEVEEKTGLTPAATDNPMELVAYDAALGEDQYKVQLSVDPDRVPDAAGNTWDLRTTSFSNGSEAGGLFAIPKKPAGAADGGVTEIKARMATGPLSFVTKSETTKGVKLLTVTYTVAIDRSGAIGTGITTAP